LKNDWSSCFTKNYGANFGGGGVIKPFISKICYTEIYCSLVLPVFGRHLRSEVHFPSITCALLIIRHNTHRNYIINPSIAVILDEEMK